MIFTRERFKCHQGVMPIPCPHFKISIVKRSQGQSAVAGAAYQSGERLFSEYDQKTKFYNKKKELIHAEIMLPPHAPPGYADRATLWNAVEAVENAVIFFQIIPNPTVTLIWVFCVNLLDRRRNLLVFKFMLTFWMVQPFVIR